MLPVYRVLLIEDNAGDARLVREMMEDEPRARVELLFATTIAEALQRLAATPVDAMLIDLGLPDSQGLSTFTRLHAHFPHIAAIVLTGNDDVELAVQAVQAGAQDYLVKSEVSGTPLVRAVQYAVERKRADEALHRTEATLRSFYENSPMLMGSSELTEDDRLVPIYDNPVAARLLALGGGLSSDGAAVGNDEVLALWASQYRLSQQSGRPVSFEYAHPTPYGRIWLSVHVAPVGHTASGRTQFCYVGEDITERKVAEEELVQRAAELQRSNAELQTFNRLSIGRELRMVELKQEINQLCAELGRPPRYELEFLTDQNDSLSGSTTGEPLLAGTGRTK